MTLKRIPWTDATAVVVVDTPDGGDVSGCLVIYRPEVAAHGVVDVGSARAELRSRGALAVRSDVRRVRERRVSETERVLPDPRAAVKKRLAEALDGGDLDEAVALVDRYYG